MLWCEVEPRHKHNQIGHDADNGTQGEEGIERSAKNSKKLGKTILRGDAAKREGSTLVRLTVLVHPVKNHWREGNLPSGASPEHRAKEANKEEADGDESEVLLYLRGHV